MKWIVLAVGVFLFFNGMTARTYSFESEARHCFNMDYIRVYGCFGNAIAPVAIKWSAVIAGAGLLIWSWIRARTNRE